MINDLADHKFIRSQVPKDLAESNSLSETTFYRRYSTHNMHCCICRSKQMTGSSYQSYTVAFSQCVNRIK